MHSCVRCAHTWAEMCIIAWRCEMMSESIYISVLYIMVSYFLTWCSCLQLISSCFDCVQALCTYMHTHVPLKVCTLSMHLQVSLHLHWWSTLGRASANIRIRAMNMYSIKLISFPFDKLWGLATFQVLLITHNCRKRNSIPRIMQHCLLTFYTVRHLQFGCCVAHSSSLNLT